MKSRPTLAWYSWRILDAKYAYYVLDNPIMVDADYDAMVLEYEDWCYLLGVKPTASEMVGFDKTRPSCQLVQQYWYKRKELYQ